MTRALRTAAPAVAVLVLVEALLLLTGTAFGDTVRYAAYLAWAVVLPGTLVHRALRGRPVRLSEDLAAGLVVGLCLELVALVVLVALGAQVLLPWWPLLVVAPMLAVPRLRRNWRWGGAPGWTTGQAWSVAAVVGAVVLWLAQSQWLRHPVAPGLSWWPRGDERFHLAVAGELKHHVPPTTSWVLGEPLDYHWFHHASLAASSMISGVELRVVLMRLCVVPLVAAAIVLTAVAAARLSGRGWAGPVAAALAFAVADLSPYLWDPALFLEGGPLGLALWYGSSQTYAGALMALAVVLLIDLLRGSGRHPGTWVLLTVAAVVMAGAKAPFVVVLGGGLGLAFAVQLLRRRLDRVLLGAGLIVFVGAVVAGLVLFRGQPQGLIVAPLGSITKTPVGYEILGRYDTPPPRMLAILTVLTVLSWCARWAGALGVLRRRWDDPVVALLAGGMVAGLAGTLLTDQAGHGQFYFVRAAVPLGAILAAWGFALMFEPLGGPRRTAALAAAATVVGVGAAATAAVLAPSGWTAPPHLGRGAVRAEVLLPIVLAIVFCGGAALLALLPGIRARRRAAVAVVLVALSATGLLRLGVDGVTAARYVREHGILSGWTGHPDTLAVTPYNLAAARWLRDHSSPDTLVATNVHCRKVVAGRCDNRQFWVAAFAERRVLVEGWGFTSRVNAAEHDEKVIYVPFWDPARLAANDAAFADPTPENLAVLRDRWGVRWLFVNRRGGGPADPRLDQVADLRFRNRDASVYELRGTR
jgi:hypothetical protein